MGRTRRDAPTRELLRFAWLIAQMDALGVKQSEFARRTGIKLSYLNQILNHDKYGKTGIGAEHVRLAMEGFKIDPAYFFDPYEGERDHRLYLLSAKRDEKRVSAIEQTVAANQRTHASHDVELARLKEQLLKQSQDLEAMRGDLRRALEALGARERARGPAAPGSKKLAR